MSRWYIVILSAGAIAISGCVWGEVVAGGMKGLITGKSEAKAREAEEVRRAEDHREWQRDKSFPSELAARTAQRLASRISEELLHSSQIRNYFAENKDRMVLTTGTITNDAQYSSESVVRHIHEGHL